MPGRRRRQTRLQAEQLEPRCVPTLTTLATFSGNNGVSPTCDLHLDSNGNLFGTTPGGGTGAIPVGTVFEVLQGSGTITTLASFDGTNGDAPAAGVVEDSSHNLFGTTSGFLLQDSGSVFELTAGSGMITTLATFNGSSDGTTPLAGVVEDSSGNLFGTTSGVDTVTQMPTSNGTVYEILAGSGMVTTLATFNGSNGANPVAGLILDSSGNLFGTTAGGGANSLGAVFEVLAGSSAITLIASSDPANGASPNAGLVEDSNGNLFGTCYNGGAVNDGTIFEVQKGGSTITALASFHGASDGANPTAGVILDSNGNLFGTTMNGGAAGDGTVFELVKGSSTVTTLATFHGTADGAKPFGGVVMDASGNLFGTTTMGGAQNDGTVFEVTTSTSPNPIISTTSLANWTVNQPGYNQTISASGGTGALTFSETGTLPPGLALSSGGVLSGTPTTAGSYSFTVTATDTLGAMGSQNYTVTINPPVTITTANLPSGTAGTAYSQTIAASGGSGSFTFSETGTLPTGLTLSSAGVLSGTATAAGSYPFTVTATDAVGASASQAYTLTISPGTAVKFLVATQGSTFQAGSSFLVSVQAADQFGNPVTSYSGPTSAMASISPTSTASNFPLNVPINSNGLGYFLGNIQLVGTYTITVAGGTFTGSAPPVTITPGPAVKLAFGMQPLNRPTGVVLRTVTVQVEDLYGNVVATDTSDNVSVVVASGPGSFTANSTTTVPVVNGVATFSNLTLVNPGTYTLSAVVPMLYTGPNSTAFIIAPIRVVPGSFVGTPSGFSLTFNAPFLVNSTTPVLYGQGFGATAPAPSVTLTGPSGPVEGSLVLNTSANSITFVETDTASVVNNGTPILPDGTYTVDVRASGATGLQALNTGGGFLDGLGSGMAGSGDFKATFTIGAAAAGDDILWVPATADGPGQPLNAPGANQTGGGYPIYLNTAGFSAPVTDVQATLTYDPTLLTVMPTSTSTFTVTVPTAGTAQVHYHGVGLNGTQVAIGFVTATVPSGTVANPMPYKAKDLLHLSGVSLNSGSLPVVTGDGLHLVAYVGDADGNGSYSGNDAVLISRVTLQADTGFTAYPLVDPVVVADTDGSGFIAADAPLQVNEAGVGFPTANLPNPPIPSGVHFQPIANNVDPTVSLPGNLHVGADGTLAVPVNLDDAHPEGSTGLIRAHLALTYDPRAFTLSAADVHPGSLLTGGDWTVVPTIDQASGEIGIALWSTTPIAASVGGSLVTIDFHPTGTPSGLTAIELVASANPGGQYVTTELEDAQGTFSLSPAPLGGFDSRLVALGTASPEATGSPAVGQPAPVNTQQAAETSSTDVASSNAAERDWTISSPLAAVAEPNEASFLAGPAAATVHVSAANGRATATVVAVASGTVTAPNVSSIASLMFTFAAVPLISTRGAGSPLGQHVDQWFQALAHPGSSAIDPRLVIGSGPDALERLLAGELFRPSSAEPFDRPSADETTAILDWQDPGEVAALVPHRGLRDVPADPTSAPAAGSSSTMERSALDRYFAQTAVDTDQAADPEED